jgi:hypothetical protein
VKVRVGTDIFVHGERQLGQYQVQIARQAPSEWTVTIPPLNVIATNFRLILWPQTLKPYPPASIPCTYITEASDVQMGHRRGLMLSLKTGHKIYMIVAASQERKLTDNIRRMVLPPKQVRVFSARIAQRDLSRLINFIEKL